MTFELKRFSDLLGLKQEQVEIHTFKDLCDLCTKENHKIIFDSRDQTITIWDNSIYYENCGFDDGDFLE